jgi:signal transduction histidine kinase
MIRVASLTNRIFLACTLLAMLSLGFAFYFVNARATTEAEVSLEHELTDAAALVDQQRATLTDQFTRMAELVADAPKLKAAATTADPATVQPFAKEYLKRVSADLFVLTDRRGRVLASEGDGASAINPSEGAGTLDEFSRVVPQERGLLQLVSVPIFLDGPLPDVLGRLTMGFFIDDALARQFRQSTGSEVAFGADGQILASSLPDAANEPLAQAINAAGIAHVKFNDEEFLALSRPIASIGIAPQGLHPVIMTLRSRTERLRFLTTVRNGLVGALILTVLLATILSYAVALTMTRPLAAVTGAMRHVAATGDLTRKVALRSRAWDDEDARVLAASFNTLTESISGFQQEAAQKDRLSSLGRLSTVVAHEIRNPLMIISAALSTLRRRDPGDIEVREAIADIDGETRRLNRLVSEVLDFAKPIRFELGKADLNDICRNSVAAAWTGGEREAVLLDLDDSLPAITTDAERLRTAFVNILVNARHAVEAVTAAHPPSAVAPTASRVRSESGATRRGEAEAAGPRREIAVADLPTVTVQTTRRGNLLRVTIRDQGTGIAADDLAHIFDPYFTTRRAGTGLGLPISRNIIEGLGGSIRVRSSLGSGTEISVDLPLTPPGFKE